MRAAASARADATTAAGSASLRMGNSFNSGGGTATVPRGFRLVPGGLPAAALLLPEPRVVVVDPHPDATEQHRGDLQRGQPRPIAGRGGLGRALQSPGPVPDQLAEVGR